MYVPGVRPVAQTFFSTQLNSNKIRPHHLHRRRTQKKKIFMEMATGTARSLLLQPFSKLSSVMMIFNSQSFHSSTTLRSSNCRYPFVPQIPKTSNISSSSSSYANKKKRSSQLEPVSKEENIIEEVATEQEEEEEEDDDDDDEFDDGGFSDDDFFEDPYEVEEAEFYVGDGGEGGGISLAGTPWDKEALMIAEEVLLSFDGDLKIYAFKTLANSTIQVRIEKLSNKSGSPSMMDIEAFSSAYRAQLDEAESAQSIPKNLSLEVSSPGVERFVRVPQELDRFKDRAMYVSYAIEEAATGLSTEGDGVFRLVSVDLESNSCTWGLADVKINREKAGKGRPLNKKQREWRLNTPFLALRLVRLFSDI